MKRKIRDFRGMLKEEERQKELEGNVFFNCSHP